MSVRTNKSFGKKQKLNNYHENQTKFCDIKNISCKKKTKHNNHTSNNNQVDTNQYQNYSQQYYIHSTRYNTNSNDNLQTNIGGIKDSRTVMNTNHSFEIPFEPKHIDKLKSSNNELSKDDFLSIPEIVSPLWFITAKKSVPIDSDSDSDDDINLHSQSLINETVNNDKNNNTTILQLMQNMQSMNIS
jgi:hypothetical protein